MQTTKNHSPGARCHSTTVIDSINPDHSIHPDETSVSVAGSQGPGEMGR